MEQKINIAELLKDCPKGMELYSPIFGNVYLCRVRPSLAVIVRVSDRQEEFLYDGRYGINGECMLFPSKENRDWSTFQRPFKDGDVVTYKYENGLVSMILNKFVNFVEVHYHCALYDNAKGFITNNYIVGEPKYTRLATEEEKEKLFNAIKDKGYKWNPETKTLEKLPKFKVGDRVKHTSTYTSGIVVKVDDKGYYINYPKGEGVCFISFTLEEYYELAPNKFDISTLKPFKSEVLVRHTDMGLWRPAIFGFISDNGFGVVGGNAYKQCIPYEDNEHLMGTTSDCSEYYKTWE